ncbi:MAG: isoprenylcysteine carboxylmethyltransferase family protein [bacterium]|nr:isoprenylcysteine carboxylmethyltransferase family protein [bacterium]
MKNIAPLVAVTLTLSAQRMIELAISVRNRDKAIARGGAEYGANHFWMFALLHSSWILGMYVETIFLQRSAAPWWPLALVLGIVLQGLRYWTIATLGEAWNTRIVVWPGMRRVTNGPYRWVRHPNYIIVGIELALIPLAFGCWITAVLATLANAAILFFVRIPAEERALDDATKAGHI